MLGFLAWLDDTRLSHFVAEVTWVYPTLETMHTVGMALLIGSLGLIDLRVLGFKPELPLLETRRLLPLAWLGFTLNAFSGTLLFVSDSVMFYSSYTFRLKIVLIVLGGINAALLGRQVFQTSRGGRASRGADRRREVDRGHVARVLVRRDHRGPSDRVYAMMAP